jgi:hypothetical protein
MQFSKILHLDTKSKQKKEDLFLTLRFHFWHLLLKAKATAITDIQRACPPYTSPKKLRLFSN